jgi:hypothetical protein
MSSIARPGATPRPAAWPLPAPSPEAVVGWLVAASAVEFLVLRTFTRVAIHIPGIDALAGPYSFLAETGRFAYYAASVLAIAALAALGFAAWRSGGRLGRLAPLAIAAILVPAALLRAGPGLGEAAPLNTIALAGLGLAAALAAAASVPRAGVAIAAFGAATLLSGWYSVAQGWAALDASLPASIQLVRAAEYLAVGAALASPWLFGVARPRRAIVAGSAVGALVFTVFLGNPATTRILLLWSHGLTGSLPAVAYAAAAGALATTAVSLLAARRPLAAFGIVLLVLGGVGIQNTYQTALVAAGLLSLLLDGLQGRASLLAGRALSFDPEAGRQEA